MGSRLFINRQFYKLSDEDKLKVLNVNRSAATINYLFYGVVAALYLLTVYGLDVNGFLVMRALIALIVSYIIVFSILSFRRLRAAQIVIPHYKTLLIFRLSLFVLLFGGFLFYLRDQEQRAFSDDGYRHLQEARDQWKKGNSRAAIEICNELIRSDDRVPAYFMNRGVYRYYVSDYEGAVSDWKKSVDMGDTTALQYLRKLGSRGKNYFRRAEDCWRVGDYTTAAKFCDTLISQDSTVPVYFVNRGVYKYDAGDEDGARLDWNHALAMGDTAVRRYLRAHPKKASN